MSNEAQIRSSLNIKLGSMDYRSNPTSFRASILTAKGPTPGFVSASVAGTDVDLSKLTTPGWCFIQNQDPTNFITVGIWDPSGGGTFFPLIEVEPSTHTVLKLSRYLQEELSGTGTHATSGKTLRVKADTAACRTIFDVFEAGSS